MPAEERTHPHETSSLSGPAMHSNVVANGHVDPALARAGERALGREFDRIPSSWHRTIRVRSEDSKRTKLYYQCQLDGCGAIFDRGGNLIDHFRKHTKHRPFTCPICRKRFTQSGSLGRHQRQVHKLEHPMPAPPKAVFDPSAFIREMAQRQSVSPPPSLPNKCPPTKNLR